MDRIELAWPTGVKQVLENVAADQILTIVQSGRPQKAGPNKFRIRAELGAQGSSNRATSMIWLLAIQLAIGPTEHYEHAKQDFAQRKFSEAASEVNAALHENPYMVPALVLKARLATFAHRPDVAKSCLITAITVDPTSEEAQFYLGVLFYEQNDFKPAISPLQAAQKLSPK